MVKIFKFSLCANPFKSGFHNEGFPVECNLTPALVVKKASAGHIARRHCRRLAARYHYSTLA